MYICMCIYIAATYKLAAWVISVVKVLKSVFGHRCCACLGPLLAGIDGLGSDGPLLAQP